MNREAPNFGLNLKSGGSLGKFERENDRRVKREEKKEKKKAKKMAIKTHNSYITAG